jgi:hypothetical protein
MQSIVAVGTDNAHVLHGRRARLGLAIAERFPPIFRHIARYSPNLSRRERLRSRLTLRTRSIPIKYSSPLRVAQMKSRSPRWTPFIC